MKSMKTEILMLLSCVCFSATAAAGGTPLAGLGAQAPESNSELINQIPQTEGSTDGTVSTDAAAAVKPADLPQLDINSWELVLVNLENPIGQYIPPTTWIEGIELDERIYDAMTAFVEDAREQGLPVYLSSGYRDYDTQNYLNQLQQSYGYTKEEADKIVAPAGTSEHQTGLACDITDYYREFKNDELEDTETYQWMSAHCQEYGFIVRYPKDKEEVTGIIYEPWHYRYVGVEAAEYIMSHHLCLEEFVALYQ